MPMPPISKEIISYQTTSYYANFFVYAPNDTIYITVSQKKIICTAFPPQYVMSLRSNLSME